MKPMFDAWDALRGLSTLDHPAKWVLALAVLLGAAMIGGARADRAAKLAAWAFWLAAPGLTLSLARWLTGQAWTAWAFTIAACALLAGWVARSHAVSLTLVWAAALLLLAGVHAGLDRFNLSQAVSDALFLAGTAAFAVALATRIVTRRGTDRAPVPPPHDDAQREASIRARLDSDEAQEGADKYTRE
ncbi:hypothetical protein M8A51_06340 [Schlegelella sp. S2-27]|uniref:Uncharacterized protein n=1 Tax=Caldimonas mangrovi TaxID=2944811 RepID=A0ABT0YK86_9BURK|nr:hypothetical protein [Caldimonas mangrovi]MCM5679147.1 hypothetical protein [Caldimonas mangrovi]